LQTNWINLNGTITANKTVLTATNVIGSDPRRFYRLLVLP
jgi:hypothetical protein